MLRISYGFETMMSSMYQKMIELVVDRPLRAELGELGATDARHSAAVAIAARPGRRRATSARWCSAVS